jgi:hypothetical protein
MQVVDRFVATCRRSVKWPRQVRDWAADCFEVHPIACLTGIVVVLWLAVGIGLPWWIAKKPGSTAGEVGDMFGTVNALFAGLAFVGLLYTVLQQNKVIGLMEQSHREQAALSVTAARLQGLSTLADLHFRMMEIDKGQLPFWRRKAEEYATHASDTLREIAPELGLPDVSFRPRVHALFELVALRNDFVAGQHRAKADAEGHDDITPGVEFVTRMCMQLITWFNTYKTALSQQERDRSEHLLEKMQLLSEADYSSPRITSRDLDKWDGFWNEVAAFANVLRSIAGDMFFVEDD